MKKIWIIIISILAAIILAAVVFVKVYTNQVAERVANEKLAQVLEEKQIPLKWSGLSIRIGHIHWFKLLTKREVIVDDVYVGLDSVAFKKTDDKTEVSLCDLRVKAHDLRYNIADSTFSFYDSVYSISAEDIDFTSPDGLFNLRVGKFSTAHDGTFVFKNIVGGNTDKPEEHAFKMGKEMADWAQFQFKEARISPTNIARMIKDKKIDIEKVVVHGDQVRVYHDSQFPCKHAKPMPQQALAAIEMPLCIRCVEAELTTLNVNVTLDGKHAGTLPLYKSSVTITDISNTPNNVLKAKVTSHFANGGPMHLTMNMRQNKRCTFDYHVNVGQTSGENLTDLMMPMLGLQVSCNIHSIKADFKGDKDTIGGTFCMRYDSLSFYMDKYSPEEHIAKLAGLGNAFAPIVIQNRNPRKPNAEPQAYTLHSERNPMKPVPEYMLVILCKGIVCTVAPEWIAKIINEKI